MSGIIITKVRVVGCKGRTIVQDVLGPDIEPWFAVDCGGSDGSLYTKDARLYYKANCLTNDTWEHYSWERNATLIPLTKSDRSLLKQAIERYVTEVAGQEA